MPLATRPIGNSCHWQLVPLATRAIGNSCHWQLVPLATRAIGNSLHWQLMPLATHAMGNSCHWQLTLCQVMPSLATHDIGLATHGFGNSCRGTLCHWQLMPRNGRSSKYSLETDRVVWHQQIKNMINLLRQSTPPGQGSQLEPSVSCPVGMVMAARGWKWIIYGGTFEGGPRRWLC